MMPSAITHGMVIRQQLIKAVQDAFSLLSGNASHQCLWTRIRWTITKRMVSSIMLGRGSPI